ncbi:MAG TPA: hypothetical protein VGM91_17510 [Conexibacter sp.]|jgi:hypothetical protein
MRRSHQITTIALAAALSLPAAAEAHQAPTAIASADIADVLADAAPMTSAPVPQDAPSLEHAPLAARDKTLIADAGDPQQLLAEAPPVTATPPATALPRTGPEVYLTLLAGGGLLLAGAGLRLRSRALGDAAGAPSTAAAAMPRLALAVGSLTSGSATAVEPTRIAGGLALGQPATANAAR